MAHVEPVEDLSWSSRGLPADQALDAWRAWASETLTPMDVSALDADRFCARWASRPVGPLHLLELTAAPQRVAHPREERAASRGPRFQLVYCQDTPIRARVGAKRFDLQRGEFVLLDNTQSYEMRMESANTAIDLIMPEAWLERWLPDPVQYVGAPYSASAEWGAPFGSLLSTLAREIHNAALPRSVIADQLGALLALAVGRRPNVASRHKAKLAHRLLSLIAERHGRPRARRRRRRAGGGHFEALSARRARRSGDDVHDDARRRAPRSGERALVGPAMRQAARRRDRLAIRLSRPELFHTRVPPPVRHEPDGLAQRSALRSTRRRGTETGPPP
jgi:hypothetical protein